MKTFLIIALLLVSHRALAYGPNGPDSAVDAEAATAQTAVANLYSGAVAMTSCGVRPGSASSAGTELDCMSYGTDGENLECAFGHWGQGDDGRFPDWCDFVDDTEMTYFSQVVSADTRITTIADAWPVYSNYHGYMNSNHEIFWNYERSDGSFFHVICFIFYSSGTFSCEWGEGSLR